MDVPARQSLVVKSDTMFLMQVRAFIQQSIRSSRLLSADENKIILAVDEAVSNIIEHAYGNHTNGTIEIEVETTEELYRVCIRDQGKSFKPPEKPEIDIQEHIRQGNKRGLGIFLMRRVMDEVNYRFRDGVQNELILTKYIKKKP